MKKQRFPQPQLHRDGTVTYRSRYGLGLQRRVRLIPEHELALMTERVRVRIFRSMTARRAGR